MNDSLRQQKKRTHQAENPSEATEPSINRILRFASISIAAQGQLHVLRI